MAERGGNEGVIKVNSFCSHRGKDWLNHRDTGFITDSLDEELPLLLEMPENQQPEEGDGDVILAENAWPQPAHPPEDTRVSRQGETRSSLSSLFHTGLS